jgi:vitamin B12 transporter
MRKMSLMILLILLVQTIIRTSAFSENNDSIPFLDPLVVTASRVPSTFGDVNRSLMVIDREAITRLPVSGIADLLEYVAGVDVRQRGVYDVQSDVSIRGGSFEQTLVMIDGVRMSEPQTGHHNMDLPVTLDEIDRIEILRGPGSHMFGPNAFAGVINVITRRDTLMGVRGHLGAGDFSTYDASGSGNARLGPIASRLSIQKSISNGYHDYTDFDVFKAGWVNHLSLPFGSGSTGLRYVDKDFGAFGFYSPTRPIEHEATKTALAHADFTWEQGWLQLTPRLYSRWHQDTFWMQLTDTTSSANRHNTASYGGELQAKLSPFPQAGTTVIMAEAGQEIITSTNLGDHARNHGGFCIEHRARIGRFSFTPGAFLSYNTHWGFTGWPGIDAGFDVASWCKVFASAGQSFRVPTYTELFYNRLAPSVSAGGLLGNPDLRPEKATTVEAGTHLWQHWWDTRLSVFYRDGRDLIDWAQDPADGIWKSGNVDQVAVQGLETALAFYPSKIFTRFPVERIDASYTFTDAQRPSPGYVSRYVFEYLKNQATGSITMDYFKYFKHSIIVRYQERVNDIPHTLVDTRLRFFFHDISLYAEAVNVFDVEYRDISSVPLPGRWIRGGVNFEINK